VPRAASGAAWGIGLIRLSKLRDSRLVTAGRKHFLMRFDGCVFMDRLRRVYFFGGGWNEFGPLEKGAHPHDECGVAISQCRTWAPETMVRIGVSRTS
jgi:hypothetical protein